MIRSFIALEVPDAVRIAIADAQDEFKRVSNSRISWVKPECIHLTLKFLGDIKEDSIDDLISMISSGIGGITSPQLSTTVTGAFPSFNRPRVFWLGLEGGSELMTLQSAVTSSLASFGFREERSRFHPHLTICRVRSQKSDSKLSQAISSFIFPKYTWESSEVLLMASILKPTGAVYNKLAALPLEK